MGVRGLGSWRKQRPLCNGADTDWNIIRSERSPTSTGCSIAWNSGESPENQGAYERWISNVCTWYLQWSGDCRTASRSQVIGGLTREGWAFSECLSRVMGNYHARFWGESGLATARTYPTFAQKWEANINRGFAEQVAAKPWNHPAATERDSSQKRTIAEMKFRCSYRRIN